LYFRFCFLPTCFLIPAFSCYFQLLLIKLVSVIEVQTMKGKIKYEFPAKVWQHTAPNGWFFVSLPVELSAEIRKHLQWQEEGWGRLKATAKISNSQWETAIWFDTKHKTYLLPLKAEIRKREHIQANKNIHITIWI